MSDQAPEEAQTNEAQSGDTEQATQWQMLIYDLARVFTPSAPVSSRDLFAGRMNKITDIVDVVFAPGQHAVIYGERGVGKTSLTTVLSEIWGSGKGTLLALRTNCDGTDTFSTIWRKVLAEAVWTIPKQGVGFRPDVQQTFKTAEELLPQEGDVTPNDVRRVLQTLGAAQRTAVIIDEFDRVSDPSVRALFADTIKLLSDQLVTSTLIIVGVADDVNELIAEHQSVERALVQIPMPRMSQTELAEIVRLGLAKVEMTIGEDALYTITKLSQGLPHYTHLLSLWAARTAAQQRRLDVQLSDVNAGMVTVLDRAQESVVNAYHKATMSTRDNLFKQVLLACALAQKDLRGYFAAVDVRQPLRQITGRPYDIAAFAAHLNALSEEGRGRVLQKTGVPRRYRYRFVNPLLQPFVVMQGLNTGMVDQSRMSNASN